jgi:hypothetical protein
MRPGTTSERRRFSAHPGLSDVAGSGVCIREEKHLVQLDRINEIDNAKQWVWYFLDHTLIHLRR